MLYLRPRVGRQGLNSESKTPMKREVSIGKDISKDRMVVKNEEVKQLTEFQILMLPKEDARRKELVLKLNARDLPDQLLKTYQTLYAKLGLPSDAIDTLNNLMVARTLLADEARTQLNSVAVQLPRNDNGFIPPLPATVTIYLSDISGYDELIASTVAPVDDEIERDLGEAGAQIYKNYVDSYPYRVLVVNNLQRVLNQTGGTPLSPETMDALATELYVDHVPNSLATPDRISDAALEKSSSFLDQTQYAGLVELKKRGQYIDNAAKAAYAAKLKKSGGG